MCNVNVKINIAYGSSCITGLEIHTLVIKKQTLDHVHFTKNNFI